MHFEILDERRRTLLNELNSLSFMSRFCMGGGTALSLQMGLRKSYDFNFFSDWHFDSNELWVELQEKFEGRIEKINESSKISTLDLYIDNVQVSFLEYNYPTLKETVPLEQKSNIKLLSIEDIACMKAIAILQRGTKKDFYDLYFIGKYQGLEPAHFKSLLIQKYNNENFLTSFCYSLAYFDDAEEESLPLSYVEYDWEEIKKYFRDFQSSFSKII